MTEPQGNQGDGKEVLEICPSCHRKNDLGLTTCWKCGTPFRKSTDAETPEPSRPFLPVEASVVVLGLVLLILLIAIVRNLPELSPGGPKADEVEVLKDQKAASRNSPDARAAAASRKQEKKLVDPVVPGPASAAQATSGAGAYHFLVTSLPKALISKGSRTAYFEGLIRTYLASQSGSTLAEKKELLLRDQYPAVEYKIEFRHPRNGSMKPFIHHAITTVIADKAYTVSTDYPRGAGEDGSAMTENLVDSLRAIQKLDAAPSGASS